MTQPLFIRTEASSSLGMGHFMRCFAIAEEARAQGVPVTFLVNEINPGMQARLRQIGAKGISLPTLIGSAEDVEAIRTEAGTGSRLLIDSYKVTSPYLEALCRFTSVILMDDVCALDPMPCHVVINAAVAAFDMPYETRAPKAQHLLGPDYATIRSEFRDVKTRDEGFVALMFGGSDVRGYSLAAAHATLEAIDDAEVHIIAGPALMDLGALKVLASTEPRIRLVISPPNVAEALKGARVVVTAAGTSVSEICAMGLMALVVVVADNQLPSMETCPYPVLDGRQGLPDDLGQWVRVFYNDTHTRETLTQMAHDTVDGKGCGRILSRIGELTAAVA